MSSIDARFAFSVDNQRRSHPLENQGYLRSALRTEAISSRNRDLNTVTIWQFLQNVCAMKPVRHDSPVTHVSITRERIAWRGWSTGIEVGGRWQIPGTWRSIAFAAGD
jgi:hypothetical protein